METRAPFFDGWRRTTTFVVAFIVLWQLAALAGDRIRSVTQLTPFYPAAALDVVLLVLLGWRWWPLLPLASIVRSVLLHESPTHALGAFLIQVAVGLGFAFAVRCLFDQFGVSLPLRKLRDVSLFCGVIGIATPAVVGLIAIAIIMATSAVPLEAVPQQYLHFVFGDASAVIIMVPMLLTFVGWKQLAPPAEHQVPPRAEGAVSLLATLLFAAGGSVLASRTNEPVLDLSFLPIAWLAIRYGFRGAAVGLALACTATFVMEFALRVPGSAIVQSESFLFASALMAQLIAGLSNEVWDLLARLSRRAYVDELTGLPNREKLVDWIEKHRDSPIVLIILDVDEMRLLNQGVGRMQADVVLAEIASRIRAGLPWSHLVARVSADEFAVALVDDRSPHALIEHVRGYFEAPFDPEGSRMFVSVAMGAVRSIRTKSADELLRKADTALDHAKNSPSRSAVYAPDLKAAEAPSLVGELHRAAENGELIPFYQPIFVFDEQTGNWRVTGAEALMRWTHPERGVLAPAAFLGLLERLSIGDHVGWDILEKSLRQAAQWRRFVPDFRVWVNMFSRQVLHKNCESRIMELIEKTGVSTDALMLEINESVVARDERDVADLVRRLREGGVACAIDDFGTGGSTLGRVRDVPASVLKIDRSFVTMSEVDKKALAVATTVVRLANDLGMLVVAEGVENAAQLEVMAETGCAYMQGYLLGHPLPADLFARTFLASDYIASA